MGDGSRHFTQSRQLRGLDELGLDTAAFGDVLADPDDAENRPIGVPAGGEIHKKHRHRAVLGAQRHLRARRLPAAQGLGDARADVFPVLLDDEIIDQIAPKNLVAFAPGDAGGGLPRLSDGVAHALRCPASPAPPLLPRKREKRSYGCNLADAGH